MMAKRERVDVSDITKSSSSISISGVVTAISPMKKSKRSPYFDGSISDSKSSIRLFGFDPTVRDRLANFESSGVPVVLDKCEVKSSRLNDDLEVLVTPRTEMEKSDKTYHVVKQDGAFTQQGKEISLSEVKNTPCFERVTVKVKISELDDVAEVKGGKKNKICLLKMPLDL